jgi:hypothetical protein
MTVINNKTSLMPTNLLPTSPQFGSAITGTYYAGGESGMTFTVTAGQTVGMRITFSSAADMTGLKWLNFGGYYETWNFIYNLETLANAGATIYVFDSSDNYKQFAFQGGDYSNINTSAGGWQQYSYSSQICIDVDATPVSSSGALDKSDIAGFEIHLKYKDPISAKFGCNDVFATNSIVITGGNSGTPTKFRDVSDTLTFSQPNHFRNLTLGFYAWRWINRDGIQRRRFFFFVLSIIYSSNIGR